MKLRGTFIPKLTCSTNTCVFTVHIVSATSKSLGADVHHQRHVGGSHSCILIRLNLANLLFVAK